MLSGSLALRGAQVTGPTRRRLHGKRVLSRKAPPTVPQGEANPTPRRVPKSTKKTRAPPLPSSALAPLSELNKNQNTTRNVLSTDKTPSPDGVSGWLDSDQPQRPPRQKNQSNSRDSQKIEQTQPASFGISSSRHFNDAKHATPERGSAPPLADLVIFKTGITKTRSSKKRPAPLPNQPPAQTNTNLPLNTGPQQEVSEFKIFQVQSDDILEGAMPSQVSESSRQLETKLNTTGTTRQLGVADSTSDSEAPPLPSSAPPPLPSSPPPLVAAQDPLAALKSADSVGDITEISIEYTVAGSLSSSEFVSGILEAPSSSRRSTFDSNKDHILEDTINKKYGSVELSSDGLIGHQQISPAVPKLEIREPKISTELDVESDNSFDSDISNEDVSTEGTRDGTYDFFSPDDDSQMSWSLTTSTNKDAVSADNNDDGVVLLSNTSNQSHSNNTRTNGLTSSTTHPSQSSIQQPSVSSEGYVKAIRKDIFPDALATAPSSKLVLSTPRHNTLDLEETHQSTAFDPPMSKKTAPPTQEVPPLKLKSLSPIQLTESSVEKVSSHTNKKGAFSQKTSLLTKEMPEQSSGTSVNPEHQVLLATTAALIRSQKSATPRDISQEETHIPKSSQTSPSPASSKPLVKAENVSLLSSRHGAEQDGLKSRKENEIVAKAMHFADMTQPKAPTFVVRKAHKDGDDHSRPEESTHQALKKRSQKERDFPNGE
ncbi:hypothetical protein EGW08_006988 [Elysia chlorotica]|uniref:Uncharacterized protein n=1 Tax=Elysia chlorotica TaxID=188477 RepID=A0A433TUI1_ELYCH|nr:hypothetical protein EGW08_006988 [Elysia chlorotica]